MKSAKDWYVWFKVNKDCRITADGIAAIQDDAINSVLDKWQELLDEYESIREPDR